MLVLFETPAGYAIFKLLDEKKLQQPDNLFKDFETPEKASKIVKLKEFKKFSDMSEALGAATAAVEGKLGKPLKKMLKKIASEAQEQLALADSKLGSVIKDKLNLSCVSNSSVQELMRCIRSQADSLIGKLPSREMAAMSLGLAHSLSRYKLKFSPDKIDTMIVQAVNLLDDLDKELNNYVMRGKEWFGWHFPELAKIITDNLAYIRTVKAMGMRTNASSCDFSEILPEEIEEQVKEAAEISMGTEITDDDIENIQRLCDQVIEITEYRTQLYEYLKNRMMAVAPNLTILVGELVGARLISHTGSLLELAKRPASTVQILGAEKALFRALKTKRDTPKFGLLYHAQMVGMASTKNKGKIARMLAAKVALAVRVDALGEEMGSELGVDHRAKLELRLKSLEKGDMRRISGTGRSKAHFDKYENKSEVHLYPTSADSTIPSSSYKRKRSEDGDWVTESKPKKVKVEVKDAENEEEEEKPTPSSKKKKKVKEEPVSEGEADLNSQEETTPSEKKKKKKKKVKVDVEVEGEEAETVEADTSGGQLLEDGDEGKRKKKKKKKAKEEDS